MHIINNPDELNIIEPTIITIGKFDGVHIGHQSIISEMKKIAKDRKLKTLVFSFDISPEDYFSKTKSTKIDSDLTKQEKLEIEEIDYFVVFPFNDNTARMSAEYFASEILIKKCNMKVLIGGTDISFGYMRSGNMHSLDKLSKDFSFDYFIVDKIKNEAGYEISSDLIKELINSGKISEANLLLNRKIRR